MYVNGYDIPDINYGTGSGREYHICGTAGAVVEVVKGSKQLAIARAEAKPLGVVPEPKPTPAVEPAKPLAAAKPLKEAATPQKATHKGTK
ncbi:hypothetical protein LCGC14_2548180 [marine sediment metagenome]|uniref:Uncharacterized protein n=1 Tax=marine sediment metagenome TaxID=412755 RepID=A0A0F9D034_9ZZZZ